MVFQRDINGIPLGFLWDVCGIYRRDVHGFLIDISKGFPWYFYDISLVFPWNSCLIFVGFQKNSYVSSLVFLGNLYGIPMGKF